MIVLRIFKRTQFTRVLLTAALLFATVLPVAAATMSASLSVDEQQFASSQANNQAWAQNRSSLQGSAHSLGVQTLSVELDERKKSNNQRRARVYQFNYITQQSRLVLIDLNSREIIKAQTIQSIHLPLNEQEIAIARALIEQQPILMSTLNEERQSRGLPPISDLSTIDVKASIFEPHDQRLLCAEQRCALVSLFDNTRTVFSVEPVVNLQQLSVTTLPQALSR